MMCMKVRINISISEEANDKLNKQPNKSKYLEDLILDKASPAQSNSMLESIREIIKEELKAHSPQVANSSPPSPQKLEPVYSSVPSEPAKIKLQISQLEAERDEELMYCQDPETIKEVHATYQLEIQSLWDQYWALVKGE